MLNPDAINKIEEAISLINKDKWAAIKILKQLLKETEDDIDHIASLQSEITTSSPLERISIALEKLQKETGYGIPDKTTISTKPLQRDKDGTSDNRREWDSNK